MLEKDDLKIINQMIQKTLEPLKMELEEMGKNLHQKDFLVKDMVITEQKEQDRRKNLHLRAYEKLIRSSGGSETRKARVIFNKAGGSASKGSQTTRITLPVTWVREMGITEDSREVDITFQNGKIIIEKAKDSEEREAERKEKKG